MWRHESLRRRRPSREPKPRFLLVCEGTRTEPSYLNGMRHLWRSLIELEISPGGTPKTLVERAVNLKREAEREAKKDTNAQYDEVWCVFDIDEHPFVREAKQQAEANDIKVAISNPCFELWILLHFQDQRAYIERDCVQHLCHRHLPKYEKKTVPCERLLPLYDDAVDRARKLDDWQIEQGRAEGNPSTGVYRLMKRIAEADRKQMSG